MGETTDRCGLRRGPRAAPWSVWVLVCVALLTTGGGCAQGGGRSDGLGDGAVGHASTDVAALGVSCTDPGFAPVAQPSAAEPTPQPLPRGFVPVSAARCEFSLVTVPGDGEWQVRDEQRADSGLDVLVAALHQPSQDNAKVNCAAVGTVPVVITLTDALGRKVVPALPHQACGLPLQSVVQAIQQLPWRSVSRKKVHQTRSRLETESGCSGGYKPMIAIEADEGSARSSNVAPFDRGQLPTALEVCRYRLDPTNTLSGANPSVTFKMGVLSSAATLSGATLNRFVTSVNAAPPVTTNCEQPQTPFAVVSAKDGAGPYLMVELSGCYRADDGNGTLRQLDQDTVALLTT